MYLRKLKIWNFRCFGSMGNEPGLELEFNPKLNLLIGANDSGKTAIIDAIRYCLGTHTYDTIRIDYEDFYQDQCTKERRNEFKIECSFSGFNDTEAGQFLEWIDIKKSPIKGEEVELRVWFTTSIKNNRIISKLRAGIDEEGQYLEGEVRDLLRVTYLKPLRDAETELSPGYRSRLYQILRSHPIFDKKENETHPLEQYFKEASILVESFFDKEILDSDNDEGKEQKKGGKIIKKSFKNQTSEFLEQNDNREPKIEIAPTELQSILRKLELFLEENKSGLGTLNLLYMAAELLHLKRERHLGIRLALIEELEAHLHPQAQLRVLKSLLNDEKSNEQYILTTHSIILGSSVSLEFLRLCFKNNVYSLDKNSTQLLESDYKFLERFLDSTKANLFFAKGVIIVEGDAENILIPTLADILSRPLYKYGVSIVNVGSKALLRYANIFKRIDGSALPFKVAIVTDLDTKVDENGQPTNNNLDEPKQIIEQKYNSDDGNMKVFVSPLKTMEFDFAIGNLYLQIYKSIQIAKKIKSSSDGWINDGEVRKILESSDEYSSETDFHKRAINIYQPLEKSQASKTVSAQWFAKILEQNKDTVKELIKKDYDNNTGIKYIVQAIEHVTESVKW